MQDLRVAAGRGLRDVFPDVLGEDLVDQRLIADALSACGLPKLLEYDGVEANRNQLARRLADRRTSDPTHGPELFR